MTRCSCCGCECEACELAYSFNDSAFSDLGMMCDGCRDDTEDGIRQDAWQGLNDYEPDQDYPNFVDDCEFNF